MMITTGLLLGGEKTSIVRQAYEVLQFEKKLASIYEKRDELRKADRLYNRITVGELLTLCPAVSLFGGFLFCFSMVYTKL